MSRHYSAEEILDLLEGLNVLGRRGDKSIPHKAGKAVRASLRKSKPTRARRATSVAGKRYGRAFRRLCPKNKKKTGSWKKDGFKRCVRAAHRECRRKH